MKEAFLVEMLLERKDGARIHNKQAIIDVKRPPV